VDGGFVLEGTTAISLGLPSKFSGSDYPPSGFMETHKHYLKFLFRVGSPVAVSASHARRVQGRPRRCLARSSQPTRHQPVGPVDSFGLCPTFGREKGRGPPTDNHPGQNLVGDTGFEPVTSSV